MEQTLVHVCRHGQVFNPDHVLYGRQPGFGLSDLGKQMAERLGEYFADAPITHLRVSPLQRARETMAPIAARHPDLELVVDPRIIEAANALEGQSFGRYNQRLLLPSNLRHLYNPLRPSWGEPYPHIVERMHAAIKDAAESAGAGGRAVDRIGPCRFATASHLCLIPATTRRGPPRWPTPGQRFPLAPASQAAACLPPDSSWSRVATPSSRACPWFGSRGPGGTSSRLTPPKQRPFSAPSPSRLERSTTPPWLN